MSESLDRLLLASRDEQRLTDIQRHDLELARAMCPRLEPAKRLYQITIDRQEPLTVEAASSADAWELAIDAAGAKGRIEVQALGADLKPTPFPVAAARQELACADLREEMLQVEMQGFIGGLPQ